ncbi:PEP-CTERM sorting domain-containing protein [Kiritimatiellaeota bacterium B1221]|nr:PEP-CTERM sorting domain-containing protein [Kiritimatiellaeota bacterium B1221]
MLTDKGVPDGTAHSTYTGTTTGLATATGTSSDWFRYTITVPESYDSDTLSSTSFQMRFATSGSTSGEDFHQDNVAVNLVSEPSTLFLFVGGILVMGFSSCRRK